MGRVRRFHAYSIDHSIDHALVFGKTLHSAAGGGA